MNTYNSSRSGLAALCAIFHMLAACSDEATIIGGPGDVADDPSAPPSNSAVMLATYVRSPDGNDSVYVRALPELPSGEIEYSNYREFGPVNVFTSSGYVFVWDSEPATLARFSVNENLDLVDGPVLSLLNQGFSGIDSHAHVVVSETRAYSMSPQLDQIIVWNRAANQQQIILQTDAPKARRLHFRLMAERGRQYQFAYSADGKKWTELSNTSGTHLPPWDRAVRVGLTVGGVKGAEARFDDFQLVPRTDLAAARSDAAGRN